MLCNNGEEELYDHKNDPHEWKNLADTPEYGKVKKRLRKELLMLSGRTN
ncbi:MAG: sulfatase/phosphatase domain-containing protein [Planctomycetota bacterium]